MKRFLCGILSICLVLGLSGCADDTFADVELDKEETLGEVTFRVDSGWEAESSYNNIYFYPFNTQDKGFFVVQSQTLNRRMDKTKLNHDDIKGNVYDFVDSWFKGNSSSAVVSFGKYNDEFPSAHISGTVKIDGKTYDFNSNILITSSNLYGFSVVQRGEIQSSFQEAVKLVIDSVSVEESTIYESFDDYAMSMSFLQDACAVLSHSIIGTGDGSYRWDLDIENVTDMDGLMVFSELVGSVLNPSIQKRFLVDGAVQVDSASIDINHGQAILFLFPPVSPAPLFVSSMVIKDEYEKKAELQAAYDKYMSDSDFGNVLASMGGSNKTSLPSSAPAEQDKPTAATPAPATGDSTVGQKNALKAAVNYISIMPFSRTGLIQQLEFEGYSNSEATYGVNHCGADWNEQAAKKAQDYMDIMPFSRDGLIDQLEFEGFTTEQAEYGASAVGY